MNKALCLLNHGPEFRYLDVLKQSNQYDEICILISKRILDVIEPNEIKGYKIFVLPDKKNNFRIKWALFLTNLCDEFAKKTNLKNGIQSFSYSKKNVKSKQHKVLIYSKFINIFISLFIKPLFWITKKSGVYLYQDNQLLQLINETQCQTMIAFEHLGGVDYQMYNGKNAGLTILYYLNNQKDLTIRPYAPLMADQFFIWYESQKKLMIDIERSYLKSHAIGVFRLQNHLKKPSINPENKIFNLLYSCSDPRRRPYELQTLKKLAQLIQRTKLEIKLQIRLNPMDSSGVFLELTEFPFVSILENKWLWNEKLFVNIPTTQSDLHYFNQISNADCIMSLPSTTLIEAVLFNKKTICLIDINSPDYLIECQELKMVVPTEILEHQDFQIVENLNQTTLNSIVCTTSS